MKTYPNGLGETLGGDAILGSHPVWLGGNVWWVNSTGGVDAGGAAGQDREKPLATLGQALTNSAAGDIIVLQYGHTETLTAAVSLAGKTIVGVGTTSGKPGAQLKLNAANASLISITGSGSQIHNVYFPANVQSNTGASGKLSIPAATNVVIYGCYFECGSTDLQDSVQAIVASNNLRIENCTFLSTATSVGSRPTNGLRITGAVTDPWIVGNIFDDGTVGFSGKSADMSGGALTRLSAWGNSLLRGADIAIHASSTGFYGVGTLSGGSAVSW